MSKFSFKKYIIFIIIIGLLVFFHFLKILSPIESFISYGLNPILKNFHSLSSNLRSSYNKQTNKKILTDKIKLLEDQSNKLIIENAKLKILEEENQLLRQNLKFFIENKYNYKIANIISRGEPTNPTKENQIIINKGTSDGLFPGLPVIVPDIYNTENGGIIIGKIVATKDNLSEVCLLNNQNCKLAGSILGQTRTNGIVHGELGLIIKMDFIPQIEKINKNNIVITSGLEQNIPQGLIIGKIAKITQGNNELWQNAIIESLINFDDLSIVSILLP